MRTFPRTQCREGQSCSWTGVLPYPVRPDSDLTWCPRPPAPPARPLSESQDVRPPPARQPAASAFTAVPRPRPGLSCACASASRADYTSRQAPEILAYNFKFSRFSKTTTTDSLREPSKGRVGVPPAGVGVALFSPTGNTHPSLPHSAPFTSATEHSGNRSLCSPSRSYFSV